MGDIKADDSSGQGAYAFGPFVVDPLKRRLWREGGLVPISSKTFDVLVVLLEHRDHSVSKDELLNLVWPDTAVNENNLARQISSLRRALGQRPDEHDFVVTIPGHGYRFVATVQELAEVPPELRNGLRWACPSSAGAGAGPRGASRPPRAPAGAAHARRLAGARCVRAGDLCLQGRWMSLGILVAAIGAIVAVAVDMQLRHRPGSTSASTQPAAHHL